MHVIEDILTAENAALKNVKPGIYVFENVSGWNPGMFTIGVIGCTSVRSSLAARVREHEKDKSTYIAKNKGQLFRHSVSPFGRFWALELTDWSAASADLAEQLLYVHIASRFPLVSQSCFENANPEEVRRVLRRVLHGLRQVEANGNHTWAVMATLPTNPSLPKDWSTKSKTLVRWVIRSTAARMVPLDTEIPCALLTKQLDRRLARRIDYTLRAIYLRGNSLWKLVPPRSRPEF